MEDPNILETLKIHESAVKALLGIFDEDQVIEDVLQMCRQVVTNVVRETAVIMESCCVLQQIRKINDNKYSRISLRNAT